MLAHDRVGLLRIALDQRLEDPPMVVDEVVAHAFGGADQRARSRCERSRRSEIAWYMLSRVSDFPARTSERWNS